MLPALLSSRIVAVDEEARPLGSNNKRISNVLKRETKPRLLPRSTTRKTKPKDNPILWMQQDCPTDILPKIMAYAGPQVASTLNKMNRFWNATFQDESMWRIMCEELYKVRDCWWWLLLIGDCWMEMVAYLSYIGSKMGSRWPRVPLFGFVLINVPHVKMCVLNRESL